MKRKIRKLSTLIIIISAIIMASCHGNKDLSSDNKEDVISNNNVSSEGADNIIITRSQFEKAEMKLGKPELKYFSQKIEANGYIKAAPNGKVNINTLIPGRVKNINIKPGEKVSRGQLLLSLEGSEIIKIQQDYAESFNSLILLKSNYDRYKALSENNIAAKKDLVIAETDYNAMLAKKEGLKKMLALANIDPAAVESGNIVAKISIYSPINGYVTELLFETGDFVEPNKTIVEIIDPNQLQLVISVFKQDLDSLSSGQTVRFYDPDKADMVYMGVLSQIGRTIDVDSRTIRCTASIEPEERAGFINNTFVEAEIITCSRETLALPRSALFTEEGKYFILELLEQNDKQLVFSKKLINTGAIQKELVEILDKDISELLLEGVYNLVE